MKLKIKSRKLKCTIEFSRPGKSYIYADLNGQSGTLGNQICKEGSTISYSGDNQEEFNEICKKWYHGYIRSEAL